MARITIRIPEYLHDALRERAVQENKSLQSIAVEAVRRGLGLEFPSDHVAATLGDMIVQPATKKYDPEAIKRALAEIPPEARHLSEALEWTREDRF